MTPSIKVRLLDGGSGSDPVRPVSDDSDPGHDKPDRKVLSDVAGVRVGFIRVSLAHVQRVTTSFAPVTQAMASGFTIHNIWGFEYDCTEYAPSATVTFVI